MKHLRIFMLICLLVTIMITTSVCAECDWRHVRKTEAGFLYSKDCHIKVGVLVKERELRKKQVEELNKSIKLKDLSIDIRDKRIDKWRTTAYSLEDRVIKQTRWNNYSNYIWFAGGIATTVLAGWALGQVNN